MSIIKIYNRQCPCQINTTIERKQDTLKSANITYILGTVNVYNKDI